MPRFTDRQIANVLRSLSGQPCTPWHLPKEIVQHIKDEGLARFHEWPSGHWSITDRGQNFLAEVTEPNF